MPEQWVKTTLGQVAEFHNGYPFKPSELTGRGRPVVRIKQLLDADAPVDLSDTVVGIRQQIDNGDLVFSWSGTLASRIWDRGPALLNQHLFRVMERPGVLRGWLHLALDHAVIGLAVKAHGTTMKHVTKKVLEAHTALLPPMAAQRRIVDLMAALDGQAAALDSEAKTVEQALNCLVDRAWDDPDEVIPVGNVADLASGPSWASADERPAPEPGTTSVIKITNTRPDGRLDLSERLYVRGLLLGPGYWMTGVLWLFVPMATVNASATCTCPTARFWAARCRRSSSLSSANRVITVTTSIGS